MTNINAPFGMRPVRHKNGQPYNGAFRAYFVPASDATALFVGDPVIKTGTSNTANVSAPGAGSFQIGALPAITRATAGTTNRITGVIVGFAGDANSPLNRPASTDRVVYVCDDPDMLFEIQSSGALAATDVGLNSVITFAVAGSAFTGKSGAQLDQSVLATTAAHQIAIVELVNREDNFPTLTASKVLVRINNHSEVNASAGV
jgi:hypothetical protein